MVTLVAGIFVRILAAQWPAVMLKWEKLEKIFLKYPYKPPKHNLTVILTLTAGFMIIFMVCK